MKFKDKYATLLIKQKENKENDTRPTISPEAYAIGEMIEKLINEIRRRL